MSEDSKKEIVSEVLNHMGDTIIDDISHMVDNEILKKPSYKIFRNKINDPEGEDLKIFIVGLVKNKIIDFAKKISKESIYLYSPEVQANLYNKNFLIKNKEKLNLYEKRDVREEININNYKQKMNLIKMYIFSDIYLNFKTELVNNESIGVFKYYISYNQIEKDLGFKIKEIVNEEVVKSENIDFVKNLKHELLAKISRIKNLYKNTPEFEEFLPSGRVLYNMGVILTQTINLLEFLNFKNYINENPNNLLEYFLKNSKVKSKYVKGEYKVKAINDSKKILLNEIKESFKNLDNTGKIFTVSLMIELKNKKDPMFDQKTINDIILDDILFLMENKKTTCLYEKYPDLIKKAKKIKSVNSLFNKSLTVKEVYSRTFEYNKDTLNSIFDKGVMSFQDENLTGNFVVDNKKIILTITSKKDILDKFDPVKIIQDIFLILENAGEQEMNLRQMIARELYLKNIIEKKSESSDIVRKKI